jgi:hypothetical protein
MVNCLKKIVHEPIIVVILTKKNYKMIIYIQIIEVSLSKLVHNN